MEEALSRGSQVATSCSSELLLGERKGLTSLPEADAQEAQNGGRRALSCLFMSFSMVLKA